MVRIAKDWDRDIANSVDCAMSFVRWKPTVKDRVQGPLLSPIVPQIIVHFQQDPIVFFSSLAPSVRP